MFKIDNQLNFIPQNYKDFLGEGHEAVILDEIINELDITEIIRSYSNFSRGTSAYHPRVFLKILFYGYMNQTFSSRKLSRKLKSDLAFMYLAGNNQPNFRTINKFRTDKGKMLEGIFFQIVSKAKTLGLISFGTMSLDGTKVYANASITKTQDIEGIDKRISQFFEEARKIDELEDTQYGDNEDNLPEELKTKEGRNKRRNEISEKKKKFEDEKEKIKKEIESKRQKGINQTNINSTDKDSRIMKMKNWGSGYNPQNITENQFIISSIVSSSPNDVNELIPTLEKVKKHYGVFPTKILADKGYASVRNYGFLEKNNIEGYIPHQKVQVNIDDYIYNKGNNTYTNKKGNIFKFTENIYMQKGGKKIKGNKIKATKYITTLKNGRTKSIKVYKDWHRLCKDNDIRLYSDEGKILYKKRSGCVENVFGNIKMNLKFERFNLRGFKKVQIEWNLISLAHNLQKLIKFKLV